MAVGRSGGLPRFVVRPVANGKSWRVYCEVEYREAIEVDSFSSEQAAQYWIDTVSISWLEKRQRSRSI
jgi:hypothetical protein